MKLLFVSPEPPFSKTQGTTLRIRGLARELARRHEVRIVALGDRGAAPAWLPAYTSVPRGRRAPWARAASILGLRADLEGRARSSRMTAALREELVAGSPDAVLLEGLETSPYLAVLRDRRPAPLVVYDAHNAEHVLQRRAWEVDRRRLLGLPLALYSLIQSRRLAELEADVCRRVDLVLCTSEPDRTALAGLVPGLHAVTVPNGIDTSEIPMGARTRPRREPVIVFVGKMDYRPNRDAARWLVGEVFPLVRAERPDARLFLVGQEPTRSVRALGRRPGVVVTGAVDDAHRYFRDADVAVAPLRMGSGTRFKILEAMALGTPNVVTTIGAEGLDVEPGRHLLVADTAREFARACLSLIADRGRASDIGREGRRLALERYDWRRIVPALETALAEASRARS